MFDKRPATVVRHHERGIAIEFFNEGLATPADSARH